MFFAGVKTTRQRVGRWAALAALGMLAGCASSSGDGHASRSTTAQQRPWNQHGGPSGDFRGPDVTIDTTWGSEGPPILWRRPLGEGYSGVVTDGERLYTVSREGDQTVAQALDPASGKTLWTHGFGETPRPQNEVDFGVGPNATPLVHRGHVVVLGYTGQLLALDAETGTPRWSHDLIEEYGGEVLSFGSSASPIADGDRAIVLVGGAQGAMAFEIDSGAPVWSSPASSVSYATPRLIDIDGVPQLLYYSADRLLAIDPEDGSALWSHPVSNRYRNNATLPLWDPTRRLVWAATQQDGGTRVLRLTSGEDGLAVEELWADPKIRIHFWNGLLRDGHVYASIGNQASILAGIRLEDGEVVWRERGFSQANMVQLGQQTLLLDQHGTLAIVDLTPQGPNVLAETRLFDAVAWTPPTPHGTRLYVRNKEEILAVELAPKGGKPL